MWNRGRGRGKEYDGYGRTEASVRFAIKREGKGNGDNRREY